MKLIWFYLILLIWTSNVVGQNTHYKQAMSIISQRGEVYFSFNTPNQMDMEFLTKMVSIDKVDQEKVYAYANKESFNEFLKLGIAYQIQTAKLSPTMAPNLNSFVQSWNTYPTYYQYDSLMQKLAIDYPHICKYHILGTLPSGRKILALQMGDNVHSHEKEARFLYTSSMHGDELTGYVLMLRLANYLLTNYGQDAIVDSIMNNVEIWINPLGNPDGAYYAGNTSLSMAKRYNGNFVDLNRNYPDPEDGQHPDGKTWQPETIIFMNFADSFGFNMSANFHGGAEVANYPWDTWAKLTADDSWWNYVCHEYADTAQANSSNGYFLGPYGANGSGVINGYQWYPIFGGRQDYMNYFHHCREFTLEISNQKLVNASTLPYYWTANRSAMLNYMQEARFGLHGVCTDSVTGLPIKAKVFINMHDMDESHVFSSMPQGDYYRFLDSSYYSISYSAPNYHTKTIDSVRIDIGQVTDLDVALVPSYISIQKPEVILFEVFPNPATSIIHITSNKEISSISLLTIQGKVFESITLRNTKEYHFDVSNYATGIYLMKLEDVDGQYSIQKIIIQ
ncbi:MAG: T9SS type A sorting domain-containing protein [Bacteroidales bacterium]|nr:T9SS type A sorting domain-containing protein [Bacteroidales bacterium]